MNTKVKVGIAGAIVAALIALIVLDQKTAAPTGEAGQRPAPGGGQDITITSPAPAGPDTLRASRQGEIDNLLRRVNENLRSDPAAPSPAAPPLAPAPASPTPAAPRSDEYVIQSGDTLETIAQAKYGSRAFQAMILEANPGLKPNALRIGNKLTLPARIEKKTEETASKDLTIPPAAAPDVVGAKTYVVQPGDTLSGISTKVYKTARYVNQIIQANPDKLSDPHLLVVGAKLNMPELAIRNVAAAPAAQVQTSAAPAGKNHLVQSGDSLWRVAEKYAADKGLGILEMMQELIKANPDKLKDEKTLLRLGWQLIVPE